MNISSRTPEGSPQQCPVCRQVVCLEPSPDSFDAPCPHCGQLLWFTKVVVSVFSFPESIANSSNSIDAFFEVVSQVIETSPQPQVLIDLSGLDQLEPRLLSMLHSLVKRCRAKNGMVILCTDLCKQDSTRSLMREGMFLVVHSREEALELFQQYDRNVETPSKLESVARKALCQKLLKYDAPASQVLQACFWQLFTYARQHLKSASQKKSNPEDDASTLYKAFIERATIVRFPDLTDRDDLWRLLVTVKKQDNCHEAIVESAFQSLCNEQARVPVVFIELFSKALEHSLGMLDSDLMRYAIHKLEVYTNQEIAEKLGVSLRTVERKLSIVRRKWMEHRDTTST